MTNRFGWLKANFLTYISRIAVIALLLSVVAFYIFEINDLLMDIMSADIIGD